MTVAMLACARTTAFASADVSELLAPAPSSDWLERESGGPSDLIGVITPQSYGTWVGDGGQSERALRRDGFVTGYARVWEQKVTQDYLSEFVLEFQTAAGATGWYDDLKLFDQTSKFYEKDLPALSTAHSVAVQLKFADGSHEWAIEFAKGNLMFDVTMDADTSDLAATTRDQAQTEYDKAPDTVPVSATSSAVSAAEGWVVFISVVALSVLIVAVITALSRTGRRRAYPPVVATSFQMSPDGAYWWDGVRWRLVATDPPPRPGP